MKITTRENRLGTFVFTRADEAAAFFCDRCEQTKTSKNSALWTGVDGREQKLCNGCHGLLLSQADGP